KTTLPGRKKVMRYSKGEGGFYLDGILLADDDPETIIHHPFYTSKHIDVTNLEVEPLLHPMYENGQPCFELPTPDESAEYAQKRLQKLNPEHKRFENPHIYKVGISSELLNLREKLTQKIQ